MRLSVYILAYNEEDKIRDAIASVSWAEEICVIDSGSTDRTVVIAKEMGAMVVNIPFKGFGDLRNRAVEACTNPWIFSLDADERMTPALREEITRIIQSEESDAEVYYVPRRNYFFGRIIRHSGWYPNYRQPQLFRKNALCYEDSPVHEGFILKTSKPIGYLKASLWQIPFKNLDEMLQKANRYSSLGVEKLGHKNPSMWAALLHGGWSFLKHYIGKLGFLDGWAGFLIALGNFEGTFYRYAKLYEKECIPKENLTDALKFSDIED